MQTPHQVLQIALELLFAEEVAQLLIYNKSNEIALELSNPQEAICYPPPEDGKTKNEHSEHQTKINACILEKNAI